MNLFILKTLMAAVFGGELFHNSSLIERKISNLRFNSQNTYPQSAVDEESYTTSCPDSLSGVGNVAGAKVQYDISNGVLCARK